MRRLFVDTSGWYAFLVAHEEAHKAIRVHFQEEGCELVTSNAIFSELFTLLVARGHESVALSFGGELLQGKTGVLHRVSEADEEEAWKILKARRGGGLSYADATTVALMNRLGLSSLVTLDGGLREFGFQILP